MERRRAEALERVRGTEAAPRAAHEARLAERLLDCFDHTITMNLAKYLIASFDRIYDFDRLF